MYIPEYSITNNTLKNIATIEYGKAIIDNTTILTSWEKNLKKECKIRFIYQNLRLQGIRLDETSIKKVVDNLKPPQTSQTQTITSLAKALETLQENARIDDFEEDDAKKIHAVVSNQQRSTYRTKPATGRTPSEKILAEMTELMDWYNSLDAKDTHPIIKAGILKGQMEQIGPFEQNVNSTINLSALLSLMKDGFDMKGYLCVEDYYGKSGVSYDKAIYSISVQDGDLTEWLEYYTEAVAYETTQLKDQILLLAKDTKVAKASGRANLTQRQEKIVVFLQDYGVLQNRHFENLFPSVSEDSVLRDLKKLMDLGIVVKRGSTKSSRYELR